MGFRSNGIYWYASGKNIKIHVFLQGWGGLTTCPQTYVFVLRFLLPDYTFKSPEYVSRFPKLVHLVVRQTYGHSPKVVSKN